MIFIQRYHKNLSVSSHFHHPLSSYRKFPKFFFTWKCTFSAALSSCVTNAASLTGSVCNFSRASAPAATSAWLLPSTVAPPSRHSWAVPTFVNILAQPWWGASYLPSSLIPFFAVMETSLEMEDSLGLQSPSQTFCLPQPPEFLYTCKNRKSQIIQKNSQTELGDISTITPVQSFTDLLAFPPNQSQEQTEIKNLCEINTMLSEPLDAYQIAMENQDPPLLPLDIPEIHQLLPHSENIHLERNSLSLEDQGTLENGIESSSGFADITALVGDFHLPELFTQLNPWQSTNPNQLLPTHLSCVLPNQLSPF
uniref:Uncharacterized protein n=1 Tax=Urocitellus parryii TaxID=9999 RepID=A0A8D2KL35_UROPR